MAGASLLEEFERDGVVVVPDALPAALLGRLQQAFAAGLATVPPAVPEGWLAEHGGAPHGDIVPVEHPMAGAGPHGGASRRYPGVLHWDEAFLELVDNEAVRPLLAAALGEDFVLDHDYGHALRPAAAEDGGDAQPGLPVVRGSLHHVEHCPPEPGTSRLWRGTANLVTVVYDLIDAPAEDGGFGSVKGSHQEGYELPISPEPDPVHGYPPLVSRVPCTAGSCVVFTETLRHCSLPWVGDGERRTVFLKFSPANDAFRKPAEERAAQYRALAPRAAQLPPRVRTMLGLDTAAGKL